MKHNVNPIDSTPAKIWLERLACAILVPTLAFGVVYAMAILASSVGGN